MLFVVVVATDLCNKVIRRRMGGVLIGHFDLSKLCIIYKDGTIVRTRAIGEASVLCLRHYVYYISSVYVNFLKIQSDLSNLRSTNLFPLHPNANSFLTFSFR